MPKIKLFRLNFCLGTISQLSSDIIKKTLSHQSITVLPASMHEMLLSQKNPKLFDTLSTFTHLTMDGMPLVWLAKASGHPNATRGYGPDLMLKICQDGSNSNIKHFLYGGTKKTIPLLKKNLQNQFPGINIVGTFSPPFTQLTSIQQKAVISQIKKLNAQIIWIGIGGPKQIEIIKSWAQQIPNTTFIGVGAAFNFHSGQIRQAPQFYRNNGLEWLFRLSQEPTRLYKRYIFYLPEIIFIYIKEFINIKIGLPHKNDL